MPTIIRVIAWIALLVFAFELTRLVLRWPPLIRATRSGALLIWPGARSAVPNFVIYFVGVLSAVVAMSYFAADIFGYISTMAETRGVVPVSILFALLLFAGIVYTSRALDSMLRLDAILAQVALIQPPNTTKLARYRRAADVLWTTHRASAIGLLRLAVPIISAFLWYSGQEPLLNVTVWDVARLPSQSATVAIASYTVAFVVAQWASWYLALRLTPECLRPPGIAVVFALLLAAASGVSGAAAALLGPNRWEWESGYVASGARAGAMLGFIVIVAAVVGGSSFISVRVSRNPAVLGLPKELRLRFWGGSVVPAGLAAIGVVQDRFEGVVAFCVFLLTAGIVGRFVSVVLAVPIGIALAAGVERLDLANALPVLIGTGPPLLGAKIGSMLLFAAIGGAVSAALICLVSSTVLDDESEQ
jgi:hypothetical protein